MKILRIPSIFVRICKCKINCPHDPVTVIHRHTHLLPQFKPTVRCFSHQFISFFIILIKIIGEGSHTYQTLHSIFQLHEKSVLCDSGNNTGKGFSDMVFHILHFFQLNCLPLGLICTPFHLTGMLCNLRQYLRIVANALFANSPFLDGKPNGWKSWRAHIWQNLDDARTGMLPFAFQDGMGYEAWVDYVLDVPMYFVYRDGKYIDALGQSFRDFLNGRLPALPGEVPTLSDWADHLTTVFPEARVKKFIEMRGADGGPWRRLCALPALWVGLLYDQTSLDAAWDLVKGWDTETRDAWRREAGIHALDARVNGTLMRDLAREVLSIAEAGLKSRARQGAGGLVPDETHFLNALKESVETGKVPADEMLAKYHGEWAGDLDRIYAEYSY